MEKEDIMSNRMHHISIMVQNTDRSLHLFRDVLGFDLIWHLPRVKDRILSDILCIPDVELELAYLKGGDNQVAVELVCVLGPERSEPAAIGGGQHGTLSISLEVDDIGLLYDQLTVEGWRPYTDIMPIRAPDGSRGRMFCFHTDESVMIEVLELTPADSKKYHPLV